MRQSHILNYSGNSALSSQVSPLFGKFGSIAPSFPIIREVLMNNTNSTNHSKQLRTWAKIINDCKAAKASGTTVKDWLKANNISHDTYYYWYAEVKKAYVNDSLPEIVPVDNELVSSSASISSTTSNFSNVSSTRTRISSYALPSIRLSINDVSIEINELTNPELLANVIKAVRYA